MPISETIQISMFLFVQGLELSSEIEHGYYFKSEKQCPIGGGDSSILRFLLRFHASLTGWIPIFAAWPPGVRLLHHYPRPDDGCERLQLVDVVIKPFDCEVSPPRIVAGKVNLAEDRKNLRQGDHRLPSEDPRAAKLKQEVVPPAPCHFKVSEVLVSDYSLWNMRAIRDVLLRRCHVRYEFTKLVQVRMSISPEKNGAS
jgi:hypothetical protein